MKKKILLGLALVLLAIQFIRPEATNPPVEWKANLPPPGRDPGALLPGLPFPPDHMAVVQPGGPDVLVCARPRHRSAKEVELLEVGARPHELTSICREVSNGAMPLPSYLWLHSSAKLSPADIRTLCDWTEAESK